MATVQQPPMVGAREHSQPMGLSRRDGAATLLVLAASAVTLSVIYRWNWPLIGDARAGAIAVLVLGFLASVAGGGPHWVVAALRREVSTQGMWLTIFASAMGVVTFALLAVDVFVNSITLLAWTTVALAAMWVVATIHHAIEPRPRISLLGRRTTG